MKWTPPDSGRAGVLTTHSNEDTYPLGLAVTFAVTQQIEQGTVGCTTLSRHTLSKSLRQGIRKQGARRLINTGNID